ncbi:DUF3883 domain-containing protein [Clostridium botulinum]|nr:DUF3883 domain-containing protein [Clostridium botulinum]
MIELDKYLSTKKNKENLFNFFNRFDDYEKKYNKPLNEFNDSELYHSFNNLVEKNNFSSIRQYKSDLISYLKFVNCTTCNYEQILKKIELAAKNKEKKDLPIIFPFSFIKDLINKCENPMYSVTSLLLFEGIKGTKNKDILSISTKTIIDNKLIFKNKTKTISNLSKDLIFKGLDFLSNSNEYCESDFLYKKHIYKKNNDLLTASHQYISYATRQLDLLSTEKKISPDTLSKSGILFFCNLFYRLNKKLTMEDIIRVLMRFDKVSSSNVLKVAYEYRDWFNRIKNSKEFISDFQYINLFRPIIDEISTYEIPTNLYSKAKQEKFENIIDDIKVSKRYNPADNSFDDSIIDTEIGLLGEDLFLTLLYETYGKDIVSNTTQDGCGYDFKVLKNQLIVAFEVKSTDQPIDSKISIHLTNKEFHTASNLKNSYYLVILNVDKINKTIKSIKMIQNPSNKLGLTNLIRSIENNFCKVTYDQFRIDFDINKIKFHNTLPYI